MTFAIFDRGINSQRTAAVFLAVAAAIFIPLAIIATSQNTNNKDEEKIQKKSKRPPRVKDGRLHCLKTLGGPKITEAFVEWAEDLGYPPAFTIPLLPGLADCVVTDPDLAREILTDKDSTKPESYEKLGVIMGKSLITELDNVKWRHARRGVAPAFSSGHIQRMNRICVDHIDRWIQERLEPMMIDRDEAFDPAEEMLRMSVAIICEAAFDQIPSEDDISNYLEKNLSVFRETFRGLANPFRVYFKDYFADAKEAWEAQSWIEEFGMKFLEEHRKNPNPTRGTVIDLIDRNPHYETDLDRVHDIVIFISAGHDTSSFTIAWALFMMAKYPQEHEKLLIELNKIPETDWPTCPALQNVIQESMRLHPVAGMGSSRMTGRDFTSKDGSIVIAKGTGVMIPQITWNRNPRIYDRPNEFLPDRWKNDDDKLLTPIAPYSLGPRNCVGQGLAQSEVNTVLSKLLGRYRFTLVEDYETEFFVTFKPKGGKIKATRVT